jgi:glyoxylate reductase
MGGEQVSRIVIANRIPASAVEALHEAGHDVDVPFDSEVTITRVELLRRHGQGRGRRGHAADRRRSTRSSSPPPVTQLKVVANVAVGYNNIDVAGLRRPAAWSATNTPKRAHR